MAGERYQVHVKSARERSTMTGKSHHGYHIVSSVPFTPGATPLHLPTGWKPFAYGSGYVICRKWVRSEKKSEAFDDMRSY
jgi:hypothetical protein